MMKLFILLVINFVQTGQLNAGICKFPTPSKSVTVQSMMTVSTSADYKNTLFVGGSGILNGACDVKNGKLKYLMTLKNGVTIKNAILDTPGLGIYCEGNCVLENIYYKRLCYHATGFGYKSTSTSYTYQVIGGAGQGSPDKYFTQSGKGTTIIKNFCAEGKYGKLWCSCGNCPFQTARTVQISNTVLKGPGLSVVSLNSNYGDKMSISGLTLQGQKSSSTKTKYICQEYKGLTYMSAMSPQSNYEPTKSGSGTCSYSASAVKITS
uniref:Probable pectate lyase F n=1 Tax=Heterodera schachtii TaxID=97005 RepID=A3F5C0_HETSC|nr:pectate lyase precursor [Heterodera schachtii]